MTAAYLLDSIPVRALDNNGNPSAGARLHTWIAGTTTPQLAYTNASATTPLSNPVVADSEGYFPQVWLLNAAYDLECRESDDGTVLWTQIGVNPGSSDGFTQAGSGAIPRTVQAKLREIVSFTDFGGSTIGTAAANAVAAAKVEAVTAAVYLPDGSYTVSGSYQFTKPWYGPGTLVYSGVGAVSFGGGGLNDATFSGTFSGDYPLQIVIKINTTGAPDTLAISFNGGTTYVTTIAVYNPATDSYSNQPISITAGAIPIFGTGISMNFGATTGHTLGATWNFTLTPSPLKLNTNGDTISFSNVPFASAFGTQNTQLGLNAFGNLNSVGSQNTALGYSTLFANTTGYGNIGIGALALQFNTGGFFNVGIGCQALQVNTSGYDNTAVGQFGMQYNVTGFSNTSLGSDACGYQNSGNENTGVGVQALYSNCGGSQNVAMGLWALRGGVTSLRPNGQTVTLTLTNASTAATLAIANPFVAVGMNVFGTGIQTGTTVSAVSGTSVTLSLAANAGGAQQITFNVTVNATLTAGSPNVTLASANALILVNQAVSGNGITVKSSAPTSDTFVQSIAGTALVLTQPATATGTFPLVFGYTDAQLSPNFNTAIGVRSQYMGYSTQFNTSLGLESLYNIQGSNNTGIGAEAGFLSVSGANNVWIGYNSGAVSPQSASASGSVCVGQGTGAGGSNAVAIGIAAAAAGANAIAMGQSSSAVLNSIAIGAGVTAATTNQVIIGASTNTGNYFYGGLFPQVDNTYTLGGSGARWSQLWAGTATINTSDEREKEIRGALNDAELAVAKRLKVLVKAYRWRAAVAKKGEQARLHVGWIAQEVIAAFAAEGLDGFDYGVCCHDNWPEREIHHGDLIGEDGSIERAAYIETIPAGELYGVRHDELLAFIVAAL